MAINFGYELEYAFARPTSLVLMLHIHASHLHALLRADDMRVEPANVQVRIHHDAFGNTCTRIDAPAGPLALLANGWLDETALEAAHPFAKEHPLSLLPEEALIYLPPSPACNVDELRDTASRAFDGAVPGWSRVQAISRFARQHRGDAPHRDVLHCAIALCRALNIPARYVMGYTVAAVGERKPTDFSSWFEAYLGGSWQAFDPSNDHPDVFRIAIAHGRDADDVPVCTAFGPGALVTARVWADSRQMPTRRRAAPSPANYLAERYGTTPILP